MAHFRRNDAVRNAPAAVLASWQLLTDTRENTPGYSSFGVLRRPVQLRQLRLRPAGRRPDVVYLLGDNVDNENNYVTGRSNGGRLLSTNAGVHFTDMTEDASDDVYPVQLHPDHHALDESDQLAAVLRLRRWRRGAVERRLRRRVGRLRAVKLISNPARLAFCQLVLSRVPSGSTPSTRPQDAPLLRDRIQPARPRHHHRRHAGQRIVGDARRDDVEQREHRRRRAQRVRRAGRQSELPHDGVAGGVAPGQLHPAGPGRHHVDRRHTSTFPPYVNEAVPFIGNAITDPVRPGWMWHGREHLFRSRNYGLNPTFPRRT